MANEHKIDHIDYDGETYSFIDQTARDSVTNLSQKVSKLNEAQTQALEEENLRARNAEQALEDSKVSVEEGKGLSSNDFTDEYKNILDHPIAMEGATARSDGKQGDVPAPAAGEEGLYLDGSGHWSKPHDTTYDDVTQTKHGLMTPEDKIKLDAMDQETDDTVASDITISSGSPVTLTEVLGNGKTKTTTFNTDGSITQRISKAGMQTIVLNTTFESSAIHRTRTVI